MDKPVTPRDLRRFAFLTGGIFVGLFAGVPLLRHHPVPVWPCVVGGVLVLWGIAAPGTLGPVYRLWMIIGRALGYVNSRILLSVVFFVLVTPIGLITRLFGYDPLLLSRSKGASTYRKNCAPRDITHMKEPF